MTRKHDKNTEDILKDIPNGKIIINRITVHMKTLFSIRIFAIAPMEGD